MLRSIDPAPHRRRPYHGDLRQFGGTLLALALAVGSSLTVATNSSASVPAGWSTVARDSFDRSATGGWGSADVGGKYTITSNKISAVNVSGGTARMVMRTGDSFSAGLKGVNALNVNSSDTMMLTANTSSTYDYFNGWSARVQSNGSAYTARLRFTNSGSSTLAVSRRVGSSSVTLKSVVLPSAVRAGQSVRQEFQVTGTSPVEIKLRAWVVGTAVPAWQIEYTDSSAGRITSPGGIGLGGHVQQSSGSVVASRDDLLVGTGGVSPSPPDADPIPTPAPPTIGRGSATVGSASYTPPVGAVFVDQARGNDSNSGSSSSPYKTVATAATRAANGKTIVIRAGTYHESVIVPTSKTLTFQNFPNEAVWFDGSRQVTNWTRSGSVWVATNWNVGFDSSMGSGTAFKKRFIGSNAMAADPDQVFVNGVNQTQVGSASEVTAGKFAVNDAAHTITIGTDPAGKEVRASDLGQAFNLSGRNSVVQGIGIRRYATTYQQRGALRIGNTGGTIRNVVITDNAMIGLAMSNVRKSIEKVTVTKNGMLGISGYQDDDSVIKDSVISSNNTQGFKEAPVSGGIKITSSRVFTVSNNLLENNKSAGIWFDASSYKMTIVNNESTGNQSSQIQVEVSEMAIIANNKTSGGTCGILIYDAGNVKVWNNDVAGSSLFGIHLAQDSRRAALMNAPEARDPRQPNPDMSVPWVVQNITIANNAFGNAGKFQFYALDKSSNRSVDSMNVVINGNLFNKRENTSLPTMVAWGKGDNHTLERYETPAALANAKNSSWRNAITTSSKPLSSMTADKVAYRSVAQGLPSDVATVTGLPAGSKQLGAY